MQPQRTELSSTRAGDKAELFVVPRDQVQMAWPHIAAFIGRVKDAPWSLGDVRLSLMEAKAQAWGMRCGSDVLGFWITRIDNTYTHKYGLVWITAGDGIDVGLPAYRETIEPWFWSQGCEWIEFQGRKGWKRMLPDYEETAVILRKNRGL
jgi:hypothetical protein